MKDEYDFSNAEKNPYVKKLKERISIRLEKEVKDYFQKIALKNNLPYQTLINLYLRDCMENEVEPKIEWKKIG